MNFFNFLLILNILAIGYSQELGPMEYCTDLYPQTNLTIHKLTGTWFGVEVITHKDRISGEKSQNDCIFVVINEITYEMATSRPLENPREIITQFGKQAPSNKDYRYLKLEWTELNMKLEYIIRYNISRNGFWFSSAPHEPAHFGDQPSFSASSGLIQVIISKENYMVLTFCETIPQRQLFSIILSRQSNTLSMDIIKDLREKLRVRHLPNIYYWHVCNGVDSIIGSYLFGIIAAIVFTIYFKWIL